MQKNANHKKPVEWVQKPIITGSWHGRDAWKMAFKRMLAFLAIAAIYLITGALLSFDIFWLRVTMGVMVLVSVASHQYASGVGQGQKEAAYGEIIYARRESGYAVPQKETERSYHPFKGYFAVLMGSIPFVLIAVVFAFLTSEPEYQLGVLPAWTENLMQQTEFADGLSYYSAHSGLTAVDVLRIIDRAMVMPFVTIAAGIGTKALLWVERLSAVLVLVAPIWYGVGYAQGLQYRARINTGIKIGDEKKKRRERKARRQRQRSTAPERLI